MKYPKYHKYNNSDPSTTTNADRIMTQILEIIEETITRNTQRIYHTKPDSIIGIDLRHAVIRELSQQLANEIIRINKFEKENSNDLRNYPWSEPRE